MQSSEHITNHILLTIKEDSWHQQLNIAKRSYSRVIVCYPHVVQKETRRGSHEEMIAIQHCYQI